MSNLNGLFPKNNMVAALPAASSNAVALKKNKRAPFVPLTPEERLNRLLKKKQNQNTRKASRTEKLAFQKEETKKRQEAKKAAKNAEKEAENTTAAIATMFNSGSLKKTRKVRTRAERLADLQREILEEQAKDAKREAERILKEKKSADEKADKKKQREEKKLKEQEEAAQKLLNEAAKFTAMGNKERASELMAKATRKRMTKEERNAAKEKKAKEKEAKAQVYLNKARKILEGANQTKKKIIKLENQQIVNAINASNQMGHVMGAVAQLAKVADGPKKKTKRRTINEQIANAQAAAARAKNAAMNAGIALPKTKRVKKTLEEKCTSLVTRIQKAQKAFAEAGCGSSASSS